MDENLADFLHNVFMVLVFISALSLFFVLNPASRNTVELIEANINSDKDIMESKEYEKEYVTVTGADIIGNILNGLETDISVSGNRITVDESPYVIDYSSIDRTGTYKVIPLIGQDGFVKLVEYQLE
jgi:hypothetical protein